MHFAQLRPGTGLVFVGVSLLRWDSFHLKQTIPAPHIASPAIHSCSPGHEPSRGLAGAERTPWHNDPTAEAEGWKDADGASSSLLAGGSGVGRNTPAFGTCA